jgi:hypothetical protein
VAAADAAGGVATPGGAGAGAAGAQYVTPRTSFSCDPRTKAHGGRWSSNGGGSACKEGKALFADDLGGSTPDSQRRSRSEGGAHNSLASPAGAAAGTPTPSRTAAAAVEARILAKIAAVCSPAPSTAAALRRSQQVHGGGGGGGRAEWQDR